MVSPSFLVGHIMSQICPSRTPNWQGVARFVPESSFDSRRQACLAPPNSVHTNAKQRLLHDVSLRDFVGIRMI